MRSGKKDRCRDVERKTRRAENFRRICTAVFSPPASAFLSLSFPDSDRELARPLVRSLREQLIARISHSPRNTERHLFARLFRSLLPRELRRASLTFSVQHSSFLFASFFTASALRSVINYLLSLFSYL